MLKLLASFAAVLALSLTAATAAQANAPSLLAAAGQCPGDTATDSSRARQVGAMRCLIGVARRRAGLPGLRAHSTLDRAADLKAARIGACGQFTHTPCGAPFSAAFRAAGWQRPTMGENLAFGTADLGSPRAILASWLQSPGHRANLLRRSFRLQGLAVRTVTLPGIGQARLWVNAFGS